MALLIQVSLFSMFIFLFVVFVSEIFILFHEVTDQYLCQNLWTQLQLLLLKQLEMCFLNYLKSRLFFKDSIFG